MFANRLVEIGGQPFCATVADINHDGVADLITSSESVHGRLAIFLGRGDDLLAPAQLIDMGWSVTAVRTADFNGDRRDDLLVVQDDRVSVLPAAENGTFSGPIETPMEESKLGSPAVADLDGDGIVDVAVPNVMAGTVEILRGRGDGSFSRQASLVTGKRPFSAAAGDFDGDGRIDLATVNIESHDLSILYGRGAGEFAGERRILLGHRGYNSGDTYSQHAIAAGDLNGDGLADLVVTHQDVGVVTVNFGSADSLPTPGGEFNVNAPLVPYIVDMNGDGNLDILVGSSASEVSVFLGDGRGAFALRRRSGVCEEPGAVVVGQFDRDPIPDVAVACRAGMAAGVFHGNGDGTFGPARLEAGPLKDWRPERASAFTAVGSRRGQGALLAMATGHTNQILVMRDFVDGAPRNRTNYEVGWNPTSLTTGGFTRHGQRDLAVAVRNYDAWSEGISSTVIGGPPRPMPPPPQGEVVVFRGQKDGGLADPMRLTVGYRPAVVKAADLNGDGLDDLLVANQGEKRIEAPGYLSMFLADGHGGFEPERRLFQGSAFATLAVADFNGDGHLDLAGGAPAAERQSQGALVVYFGSGDGSFGEAHILDSAWRDGCLAAGDFDGDGLPDVVAVSQAQLGFGSPSALGWTGVYYSRAGGIFEKRHPVEAGPPLCVEVNDFNGDLRPDLAVLNWSHEVSILLGGAGGLFQPRLRFATAGPAGPLVGVDLDGDGRADLAAAVPYGVSILMNRGGRSG